MAAQENWYAQWRYGRAFCPRGEVVDIRAGVKEVPNKLQSTACLDKPKEQLVSHVPCELRLQPLGKELAKKHDTPPRIDTLHESPVLPPADLAAVNAGVEAYKKAEHPQIESPGG
ncbi:hypothetical protein VTI74DRAFT_589 [Chaetomium olivicolor]